MDGGDGDGGGKGRSGKGRTELGQDIEMHFTLARKFRIGTKPPGADITAKNGLDMSGHLSHARTKEVQRFG